MNIKRNHIIAEDLPLMDILIDFENGNLELEGCWYFMIASNNHNGTNSVTYHSERVQIEATILDRSPVNLNDPQSDGLAFAMQGVIKDGTWVSSCSGLIVLENIPGSNGLISNQWVIRLCIYDLESYDCEIRLKLPVYLNTISDNNN
jgi:hypothetical protein